MRYYVYFGASPTDYECFAQMLQLSAARMYLHLVISGSTNYHNIRFAMITTREGEVIERYTRKDSWEQIE